MDRLAKVAILIATLLPFAEPASAGNFATCLLDELPGTENDQAAYAVHQVCKDRYPAGLEGVERGSGRGFFGYESGAECTMDKARETRSRAAAFRIRAACNRLYGDVIEELGLDQ